MILDDHHIAHNFYVVIGAVALAITMRKSGTIAGPITLTATAVRPSNGSHCSCGRSRASAHRHFGV
jgi:hypothetical protein